MADANDPPSLEELRGRLRSTELALTSLLELLVTAPNALAVMIDQGRPHRPHRRGEAGRPHRHATPGRRRLERERQSADDQHGVRKRHPRHDPT
jgi:hypothetical protein